jgi:hypothetical protein
MKNITTKNKTKKEKQKLKKYKQVQKEVLAGLTKSERKALGL